MQGFLELLIATFEKKEDDPSSFQLTTHLQSYNQIKLLAIYIFGDSGIKSVLLSVCIIITKNGSSVSE